jgi:hypothetical protein
MWDRYSPRCDIQPQVFKPVTLALSRRSSRLYRFQEWSNIWVVGKSSKDRSIQRNRHAGVVIYHPMVVEEDFERCAYRLLEMVKHAQRSHPAAKRILYIDVDGHRNQAGGFDRDASEIINHFIPKFLGPYLTEFKTPLVSGKNKVKQRNDIPQSLTIEPPPEEDLSYDVDNLMPHSREEQPVSRNSPPSVEAISNYIGVSPPRCLICLRIPVERAHAVPKSLGGSYDIRNFALLCPDHHKQAPDIADSEGFWKWIDYMVMRNSRGNYPASHPEMLGVRVPIIAGTFDQRDKFTVDLQRELVELYGWQDKEFSAVTWAVNIELHKVLENATGFHFGITRKPSTYAWAYDIALRRINGERHPYFPIY